MSPILGVQSISWDDYTDVFVESMGETLSDNVKAVQVLSTALDIIGVGIIIIRATYKAYAAAQATVGVTYGLTLAVAIAFGILFCIGVAIVVYGIYYFLDELDFI